MKTIKEYISTAEGMKQMWEKVNEVIDGFDFNKVATVMEALNWGWACGEEEADLYADEGCRTREEHGTYYYYPEYPQLLKFARDFLMHTIEGMPDDEKHWSSATGGFKAEVWISTDEERAEYWGGEIANVDDFAHSVDLALYFIAEENQSF